MPITSCNEGSISLAMLMFALPFANAYVPRRAGIEIDHAARLDASAESSRPVLRLVAMP
jgi:hypothetical protein